MLVLNFVIPVACTYGEPVCDEVGAQFYLLIIFLMSGGRGRVMVFSYQSIPPRSMRVVLCFWWLVDFCNKYMSSSWLTLSPWIIRTLTFPPLLASYIPCKFRRYHTPTIYLPQNSHHTYLLWHFHSHSEIYFDATFHRSVYMTRIIIVILLFAWSCSWHRICGKATFIIFIHVTLDSLHIPVHRRWHSYRVIYCSRFEL